MANSRIYLDSDFARQRAKRWIDQAPSDWVCEFRKKRRSDVQNDRLHAMIDDIRTQVPGADRWSKDEWKLRFMHALRNETRFLEELDGNGMFPVGQKTSELNVGQFTALIDLVFEWGGRNGVQWTDESRDAA